MLHQGPFFIAFSETLCTEKQLQLQLSKTTSSSSSFGSRQSNPSIVANGSVRRRTLTGSQQKRHPQERGFECGRRGQWRLTKLLNQGAHASRGEGLKLSQYAVQRGNE
ncbi:hypothetical protein LR48_Vigan09g074200 [Vigna angularis]|uniref:Uncharacterized protein n=2 Tax=Phaseolus angularis TaxID=3914 RepID=A0A0L9VAQ4_PHAAN|nr:uncharacterized protein HKW66_Vig0039920 [Vigna angularis]KOM52083.1 hypothetical protein LR48_Vigan09g074200 [Vigna angularis]